jgi:nitroreductase
MELFEAIHGRRSIRQFVAGTVDDATVRKILAAAMSAPSAGNEQPWHFLVIRDRAILSALSASHPYAEMVQHASLAVLVCADMKSVKHKDYWPADCAAASQNILLSVHALGLGSVWVGVYPREARITEIRRVIPLPDDIIPFCLLPIGIPGEAKSPEDRYNPGRTHEDRW